jgi:hypothetical protein
VTASTDREELKARLLAFFDARADGSRDEAGRRALLAEVAAYQRQRVRPYGRRRGWEEGIPALPTDVFRFVRVASFPEEAELGAFRTSGTTSGQRGRHPFRDLALYDRAARHAARYALFPDQDRVDLVVLAAHPDAAPDSSLSYMLGRFEAWFGAEVTWCWRGTPSEGALDVAALVAALERPRDRPVALLGTAFAFVHAEDLLDRAFALPAGSRAMQTGGTKGRSRSVTPEALREAVVARYGLAEPCVIAEYGMTEMSSQLYELTARQALRGEPVGPRRLWWPGWVSVAPVDPETLAPVPAGVAGVLRLDDLANLDTVAALQTADLARLHPEGLELLGRSPGAVPRGCSLAIEEAVG